MAGAVAALRGNRPMISIDPKAIQQIGAIKQAVVGLRKEISTLADEAQRYARAMGGGGAGVGPGRTGSPHQNFPAIMGRGGGRPAATRSFSGGLDPSEEIKIALAANAGAIIRGIGSQIGGLIQRERVTTRLAMAQTGVYTGAAQATPWQSMLRGATGYTSMGDLYAGANQLGQLGLMRAPNDPRTQRAVRQAGELAVMGGTNFQGGAGIMGTFMAPQTVNALRQRGIQATPGGQLNMFGGQGVLEKLFTSFGGQRRGEDFWRTGMRPGSPLYQNLQAMGLGQQEMGVVQQYGLQRAEGRGAADVERDIRKRYKDTGETMRQLQAAVSALKDVLAGGLIPIVKTLTSVLKPAADAIRFVTEKIPQFNDVIGLVIGALLAWQVKIRLAAMLGGRGEGLGGVVGAAANTGVGGRVLGGLPGGGAGYAAGIARGAGWATAGMIGGDIAQHLVGGEHGSTRSKVGGMLGGAARGAGTGALIASVIPIPVISQGVGAAVGGVVGGALGWMHGDAWSDGKGDAYPSDSDLIAHPPPASTTQPGGPLPGSGNSAHLNPDFVGRLQKMFAANPRLRLTSGWRSHEEQAYLRWQLLTGKRKAAVAPVGHSRHESGNAADIGPPSEYGWLQAHAKEYGVENVGAKFGEAWHYEPIGVAGAATGAADTTTTPTGAAPAVTAPVRAGTAAGAGAKIMPPVQRTSSGMQEADVVAAFFAGGGYGNVAASAGSDTAGDAVPVGMIMPQTGVRGGGDITIHSIQINLTLAKGTYEEAEKTARYLGQLMGDRDRLMALAGKGK